jgi:hypothetical protein
MMPDRAGFVMGLRGQNASRTQLPPVGHALQPAADGRKSADVDPRAGRQDWLPDIVQTLIVMEGLGGALCFRENLALVRSGETDPKDGPGLSAFAPLVRGCETGKDHR